ncbi:MAG TPA: BlaI/MecI/CopY family transcriptional regulator [Actinocatenispora sp.]
MSSDGQDPADGLTRRVWQVLADAGTALTPAQVRDALGGGWAYTTVTTVLTRLVRYGAAARQRAGRAYAYTAVADRAELTARRMSRLLASGGGDRAAVLARFVDVLSDEDEQLLGDLLAAPRDDPEDEAP